MAILMRSKTTVSGLTTDLTNLTNSIAAEVTRATTVEGSLASLTTADKTDLVTAINSEVTRAGAAEGVLTTNLAAEVTRATAAEAAEAARAAGVEGALASLTTAVKTDLVSAINSEVARAGTAEAALGVRIDHVLSNTDPVALDSLAEIVTAFQAADSSLNGAITSLAASAGTGLTDEVARATAAEGVLTTNLAAEVTRATGVEGTLASLTTAVKTDLVSAINSEAARAIAVEGALASLVTTDKTNLVAAVNEVRNAALVIKSENVTVASDKIVLAAAPKGGAAGILNFTTVRLIEAGLAYDAPVTLDSTDATGKTFIIAVDTSGQWDTKSVAVQYMHALV